LTKFYNLNFHPFLHSSSTFHSNQPTSTLFRIQFIGLYRGITSPLYCLTFINAIIFGVYGNLSRSLGVTAENRTLASEFACGATAGVAQTFITSPMELIKTRKQLNTQGGHVSIRSLIKQRELFRGLTATIARDAPAFGTYFATYQVRS